MSKITWVQDGDYGTITEAKKKAEKQLAKYIKKTNSRYIIGGSHLVHRKVNSNYKWGLYFIDNGEPKL